MRDLGLEELEVDEV